MRREWKQPRRGRRMDWDRGEGDREKKMIEEDRVMICRSSGFEDERWKSSKRRRRGAMEEWGGGEMQRYIYTVARWPFLSFKTAAIKQLSDTEGCALCFLFFTHCFPAVPTFLIITPSRGLFVSLSSLAHLCFPLSIFLFCFLAVCLSLFPSGAFVCLHLKYSKTKGCCFIR